MKWTMLLLATLGALLALTAGPALANHPGGLDITLSPQDATKG